MKRLCRQLFDKFAKKVKKMSKEEIIVNTISIIIGVIIALTVFLTFDKVPATMADYEPLEKQELLIQQNPELLLKTNCNINVNNDIITVTLENSECEINVQYNQNFEVLSTSKKDKCMSWILAFVISAVTAFWIYVISFWVIYSIIIFMEFLYNKIKLCKAYFNK